MTSAQRLNLICRTLLLPFRDPSFGQYDPLLQKTIKYRDFLEQNKHESRLYHAYMHQRDEIIKNLCQYASPQRLDEVQQMLELFYSDSLLCKKIKDNKNLEGFYIDRILEISRSFVTLRDGIPSLRFWTKTEQYDLFGAHTGLHKAELWNMLARLSTPDLWIASYYVNADLNDIFNLSHVPDDLLLADRVLMKKLSSGFAETHMHFNAGLTYQALWELVSDITTLQHNHKQIEKHRKQLETLLMAGMLRLFLAFYLNLDSYNQDFLEYFQTNFSKFQKILGVLYAGYYGGDIVHGMCSEYFQNFERYTKLLETQMNIKPFTDVNNKFRFDLLSRSVFYEFYPLNTSCDILLFYKGLYHIKKINCPQFRHAFLQYIRLKNYFFDSITQWEGIHGLKWFRSFYQRSAGTVYNTRNQNPYHLYHIISYSTFRSQSRMPYLKRMEVKINPQMSSLQINQFAIHTILLKNDIARQLWIFFDAYIQFLLESAISNRYDEESETETLMRLYNSNTISFPTPGIIYHFIKPDFIRSIFGNVCWSATPNQKALSPNYVETLRQQSMAFCDALHEMILCVPYLGDYIVGLDAASEELNIEPWVYAPVFVYARSKHNTYPRQFYTQNTIPNLGLTYHVGEEFRHLISGLRVTDEVLEHFGMKAGDRLGHAISLQIDPVLWQQENKVCSLPIIEQLENLLWLWNLKNTVHDLEFVIDVDKKILELSQQLYGNSKNLSPYLLWSAYQKKFIQLNINNLFNNYDECKNCICEYQYNSEICCPIIKSEKNGTWTVESLLLTHFCPYFLERYRKPIFVQIQREEVELFNKLQSYLKKKTGQLGITIEVNPTSNSSIGAITGIFQHPILKLNNRGLNIPNEDEQHLSISINSDDPLVFHTTVENEISYIYYKITDMGYCREDVLNWIDQVRKCGMESSFIQREKSPDTLLNQMQNICDTLKKQYLQNHSPV